MLSRLAVLIHLMLLCVSLNCLSPQLGQAQVPRFARAAVVKAPEGSGPFWNVKGWGQQQAEAEQDALTKARELIQEYLRKQKPPLLWAPPVSYIRENLIKGQVERREDQDQDVVIAGEQVRMKCWSLPVGINARDFEAVVRMDAQDRAEQQRLEREARARGRLLLLARVLVALVAVLIAVIAYIRVDEWTKGYYSRWLGLAAAGFLAAVGAGVMLLA